MDDRQARAGFRSQLWAGFECSTPLDRTAGSVDLLQATGHDRRCDADYALLLQQGIRTVREGLSWRLIDNGAGYDFCRYRPILEAGRRRGIQQVWDLDHFSLAESPFAATFVARFAAYAREAVRLIARHADQPPVICPINEISFLAGMAGDWGQWFDGATGRGDEVKRQLVRASIAAMDVIRTDHPEVRFLQVDPIFRRAPKPPGTAATEAIAEGFVAAKFQALDMLAGTAAPELGGDPGYIDLIGANYYVTNQEWIVEETPGSDPVFQLIPFDGPGRVSVADMLAEVYGRYGRPLVLTETGAEGTLRNAWWRRIVREVAEARDRRIPVLGVCCYPVIDSPDWTTGAMTAQGFWDLQRRPHPSLQIATAAARRLLEGAPAQPSSPGVGRPGD